MAARGIGGRKMRPGWRDMELTRRGQGEREEHTLSPAEHDLLLASNLTTYNVAKEDTTTEVWSDICKARGIELLTVHWPDMSLPDFTACRV